MKNLGEKTGEKKYIIYSKIFEKSSKLGRSYRQN